MANLKLIKVTGKPFNDASIGKIGIQRSNYQFDIIREGSLYSQESSYGKGWKYATAEEIAENWKLIYLHWTPEVGDNVIVTQDYSGWANCKGTITAKDASSDYYRVESETGRSGIFDYSSQMILAPYVKHYIEPEKPEKPPRRFKVGDKVTYKSLAQCNGSYNYGGEDQTGFVGIVESEMSYESDKGCYGLRVTTKGGDYCYNMLESEFHEYDFGYVPITSGAIGSSQPATRLVIKGSSAAADANGVFVSGVVYPIRLDSSDGSTHSTIATIDSDPLSSYKQKPITIKPKPKTKLTTI